MRDVHFKNLAKFYSSVTKEEVYFKAKDGKYYMFADEENLTYIYFNLITDRNNCRFVKIGITKDPERRKRENDRLFTRDSEILCLALIPFAKELEHYIHNVHLGKKHRAERFFDLDFNAGTRRYIDFNNKETYIYDEVKNEVNKIISEIEKVVIIDNVRNLRSDILIKHLVPDYFIDQLKEDEEQENLISEVNYDYNETIKANVFTRNRYRISVDSQKTISYLNKLSEKDIDCDKTYIFIKKMCSRYNKNKTFSLKELRYLNYFCNKYLG